ncbi:hypothetical protein EUX98_g9129 [Antrodiella citrinella]|uniref:BTB domain-containing protein n=1 Tax=Antrodiella citrinella TaxID=2447956 RepID=A0A4S4LXU0_9APHY|nr:hypothetical protein EUX98_g9129 [Antrodiella citrinella]
MSYNSPYGTAHHTSSFIATPPTPTQHNPSPNVGNGATTTLFNHEPQTAVEKIRRHHQYYLIGGDVHFLVENYLFRVHRYFFERESAYFREKLAIPAVPGGSARGSSDTNPFPLEDVQAIDFSRFLWVFYNPKYSIYDAMVEDWSAILKLSYEWRFAEVKQLACRELEKFTIDPVQKIWLYQCYDVDRKLLVPSYSALTIRVKPLSIDEGRLLGMETALLLAEAREYARGPTTPSGARSPSSANLEQDEMSTIIAGLFNINMSAPSILEQSDDVFGIVPASPPRPGMTVPSRPTANGSPSHSRQPSRNLERAPSPALINTGMPTIGQTLRTANAPKSPPASAAAASITGAVSAAPSGATTPASAPPPAIKPTASSGAGTPLPVNSAPTTTPAVPAKDNKLTVQTAGPDAAAGTGSSPDPVNPVTASASVDVENTGVDTRPSTPGGDANEPDDITTTIPVVDTPNDTNHDTPARDGNQSGNDKLKGNNESGADDEQSKPGAGGAEGSNVTPSTPVAVAIGNLNKNQLKKQREKEKKEREKKEREKKEREQKEKEREQKEKEEEEKKEREEEEEEEKKKRDEKKKAKAAKKATQTTPVANPENVLTQEENVEVLKTKSAGSNEGAPRRSGWEWWNEYREL